MRRPGRSTSRTHSSTSGSRSAGVQLEHVVRGAGQHVSNDPDPHVVLVQDGEPDEIGDVVGVLRQGSERISAHGQLGASHDGPVELDRMAPAADLPRDLDARRHAVDEELGADVETPGLLTRLLDDEGAVEAVRTSDAPDVDEVALGSVGNLEDVTLVGARAARADDAAESPRDPALLPDHLADVVRRDVEVEDHRALTLFRLDAHRLRLVDEPSREPLEELGHAAAPQPEIPAALMSRETGSVGCAPFDIQSLIFASSRSIVDGSVCGL